MILELQTFDYLTSPAVQLLGMSGLLENLPKFSRTNSVRLLAEANTLSPETILQGFLKVVTPDHLLPPSAMAYRIAYEDYLQEISQNVRYVRLRMFMDEMVPPDTVMSVLAVNGIQSEYVRESITFPFSSGLEKWRYVIGDDGRYYTVITTKYKQYGNVLYPTLFHHLLAQSFPLWISLQIHALSPQEITYLFRSKRANVKYGLGAGKDKEAEFIASAMEELQTAMYQGETLYTFTVHIVVGGNTIEELEKNAQIVRVSLPLYTVRHFGSAEVIKQVFTQNVVGDVSEGTLVSTQGASILCGSLLSYRRRTNVHGIMLGIDNHQSPVVVDLFDRRASSYNMVVLGQTGAGKTFGVLTLMLRHMLMGTRLIIIDPQGNINLSFLDDSIYSHITLGKEGISINPLDRVYDEFGIQIDFAVTILRLLGIHENSVEERAILDKCLTDLYNEHVHPTIPQLLENILEFEKSVEKNSKLHQAIDSLKLSLRMYIEGSRKGIFGEKTTVDLALNAVVNVFDVSRLPDQGIGSELRKAYLLILLAHINRSIRRRRERGDLAPILFFVDELGILIRDREAASFVSAMYKTSRSRLVGMIVADQDLHSLLGPQDESGLHHGVPILANSANILIFKQNESELDRIREHFPVLPEELVQRLPGMPVGVCVASLYDGDLRVVNILPSPLERVILSSRLQDRERIKALTAQIRNEAGVK